LATTLRGPIAAVNGDRGATHLRRWIADAFTRLLSRTRDHDGTGYRCGVLERQNVLVGEPDQRWCRTAPELVPGTATSCGS